MIHVRKYRQIEAKILARIYYNTIHSINASDYSKEQLNAWAPKSTLETKKWIKKWEKLPTYVALIDNTPVGFAEFDIDKSYIDCFFVHHEYQGKGVGTALMNVIFDKATLAKIKCISSDVSITAQPFFKAKGFKIVTEQTVNLRGIELQNFIMEKYL